MPHLEDLSSPAADSGALAADAERLGVALRALAERDRVLAERTRRLTSLEDAAARLVAATARLDAAQSELSALRRARQTELAERDLRIADLEQRLVVTTIRQREVLEAKEAFIATLLERLRQPQGVEEGPDDFKRITGVGPAIEALLHSTGITTFEQVAALSDEDVSHVGDLLGVFRERIQRDRWIEQAAEFARRRRGPGGSGGV